MAVFLQVKTFLLPATATLSLRLLRSKSYQRTMERQLIGQTFIGLAFLLGPACIAHAGSFVVNPVRVTLSASQPVSAITVRNEGPEPTVVQLETVAWSQKDGADVLAKTQEILATPPIFTIPSGGSQIVRVGLRRVPDAGNELTYRLFLQEVPPAQPISQGLRVALRVSMPVFVSPQSTVAAKLEWRASQATDGKIRLQASNSGAAHIQIAQVAIVSTDGDKTVGLQKLAAYVLPANRREWLMKTDSALPIGSMLRVLAQTDAGEMRADIRLESDSATAPAQSVVAAADAR
jgi:fimbrial chaperone protein